MNRASTVVLVLLLFLGAAIAFVMFGGEGAPTATIGDGDAVETADTTTSALTSTTDAASDRAAPRERTELGGESPLELDPEIRKAMSGFRGRVLTAAGEPVEDRLVQLFRFAADSLFGAELSLFVEDKTYEPDVDAGETRTDAEGKFEITGVWPRGFYLLKAAVDGDNPTARIIDRCPSPGEIVDLGDIVLEDGGIITGVLVNQDGDPVGGALIRAVDLPGALLTAIPIETIDPEGALMVAEDEIKLVFEFPSWVKHRWEQLPIPTTRSGSDGSFRLTGVAPGSNFVAITAPGLLSFVKPRVLVQAGKERDLGRLRMREGEAAIGKVVDERDEPVPNAEIAVAAESTFGPVHFARPLTTADADGAFEVNGFPNGNVVVAARRRPKDPWTITEPQPVTEDVVVRLPSTFAITLALVSDAGIRIEQPRLQLSPGPGMDGGVEMALWGATKPLDLDSRLSRLEDGRYVIADVPPGYYTLLATSPGHAVAAVGVEIETADVQQTVHLQAEKVFQVQVVNTAGEPVRNAAIFAESRGQRPRLPEFPVNCGRTDRHGVLLIDEVHSTEVALTAQHPAYGTTHARTPVPPPQVVQLVFDMPGAIEGELTEGGQPPTIGKWMIALEGNFRGPRGAMPDMPQMIAPNLEGKFRISGLRPGRYVLSPIESVTAITSPGKVMMFAQNQFLSGSDPTRNEVTVEPGQVARITIDALEGDEVTGPSAIVAGTVTIDGRLGTGTYVMGWGEGKRYIGEVDDNGRFDLGRVKAGDLHLQLVEREGDNMLMMGQRELWSRSYEIVEGADQELQIQLQTSSISGVVMRGGEPIGGARVRVQGQIKDADGSTNGISFNAETDAQGRFEFTRVPAGQFTIQAEKRGLGKGGLPAFEVVAGLPASGTIVPLRKVVQVRGRIDLSVFGDQRPEWMWMQLQPKDGPDIPAFANVSDDGSFSSQDVIPGTYRLRFSSSHREEGFNIVPDGELTVPDQGLEGAVVRLRKEPVKPKKPPEGKTGGR